MFDRLDPRSPIPLYAQVADRIKVAIVARELPPGTLLESVRALAARLRINPATVVQAYRQLETEGFVEMRQGSGSYVREISGDLRAKEQRREAEQLVRALVKEAGDRGIHIDVLRAAFAAHAGATA
ncbi:MAG TPA: GntR family transcriptional regulator [Gemmatimonadales bacterium]|nr:GntR family transcriptional regulator [Gemmatimonadales bacterium]